MSEKYMVDGFCFQNKSVYDRAIKEHTVITSMRKKYKLSEGKTAWMVYQKAVKEEVFTTVVGYSFLKELQKTIEASGKMTGKPLAEIPVKAELSEPGATGAKGTRSVERKGNQGRYKVLYEGQRLLNRRLKFVLFALIVLLAALVVIDAKSEYSVFTYFTDYKTKMEEELINKYEAWESELKAREDALNGNGQ